MKGEGAMSMTKTIIGFDFDGVEKNNVVGICQTQPTPSNTSQLDPNKRMQRPRHTIQRI